MPKRMKRRRRKIRRMTKKAKMAKEKTKVHLDSKLENYITSN